ncbi:MAG: PP2C family protein-serine/threonine phosphatase [Spirochaetales bacterium]|nr:PP2C family protein-serine/threonine phosphatase [Spirochaetales bacterium]
MKIPFIKVSRSIAFKSITAIVLMLIVFSIIICAIGYHGFTDALIDQYTTDAFMVANVSTMMILPGMIDRYLDDGGENQNWYNVYGLLKNTVNTTGVEFDYVITVDRTDYNHVKFLFAVKNSESEYEEFERGYVRETTNEEYREAYRALYEGTKDSAYVIRDKGNLSTGRHITVMVPLKDSGETVAIICVQVQLDRLEKARNTYIRSVLIVLLVLTIAVIVTQGLYFNSVLIKPVRTITAESTRFAHESVKRKKKLASSIRNKDDEISLLADSIDRMETQIVDNIKNITAITAEKQRITTELSLASRIQADALPSKFPAFPDRSEFDLYASMNPAKEVGGDFYDFFLIDDDHLCVFIADVSGKGIPAALFMMSTKTVLSTNAMKSLSPAKILENTNDVLCSNSMQNMFVTVWLGILEISTGKLVASNAGHEYPVIRQPGGKFELLKDFHGPFVGGFEGVTFKDYEVQLGHGSKLFVYTDGIPEATDSTNGMFGLDRLVDALNVEPKASPQKLLENVKNSVDGFVKEAEQFDDLTMLCLEYK